MATCFSRSPNKRKASKISRKELAGLTDRRLCGSLTPTFDAGQFNWLNYNLNLHPVEVTAHCDGLIISDELIVKV
jgi:hypothetical protein